MPVHEILHNKDSIWPPAFYLLNLKNKKRGISLIPVGTMKLLPGTCVPKKQTTLGLKQL
jgi:hypothetical protein